MNRRDIEGCLAYICLGMAVTGIVFAIILTIALIFFDPAKTDPAPTLQPSATATGWILGCRIPEHCAGLFVVCNIPERTPPPS